MIKNVLNKFGFVRIALVASVGLPLIFASNSFAQSAGDHRGGRKRQVARIDPQQLAHHLRALRIRARCQLRARR